MEQDAAARRERYHDYTIGQILRTLAGSLREYTTVSLVTPLFMIAEVVIECIIPFYTSDLIDRITEGAGMEVVASHSATLILLALVSLAMGTGGGITASKASAGLAKNLRHDMYASIQSFSFSNIDHFTTSSLVTRLTTDTTNVQMAYMMLVRSAMRGPLMEMIRREIELHKRYGNGEIIFKCNQLVDAGIIRALYRASMAGVRVRLQVRGICCLRPGLPGISENITVTSIVGRFLEHSRIYWFHANGEDIMYIGSADLMPRNLDHRIEVLTPILDPELRRKIREDILEVHLADNVQTWQLQADATYTRLKPSSKETAVNAQERMIAQHISRDDI